MYLSAQVSHAPISVHRFVFSITVEAFANDHLENFIFENFI